MVIDPNAGNAREDALRELMHEIEIMTTDEIKQLTELTANVKRYNKHYIMCPQDVIDRIKIISETSGPNDLIRSRKVFLYVDLFRAIADDVCQLPRTCIRILLHDASVNLAWWC